MALRLASGSVGSARRPGRRGTGCLASTVCSLTPGGFYVVLLDLFALALAQEAVVDEHTGQLVTYRPWTRAAATAESTPPDRAADHWLLADRHRRLS